MNTQTSPRMTRAPLLPPLLFAIALATSAFVWWTVALPVLSGKFGPHATHAAPVYVHAVGGTLMLLAGSAALFIGWTRRAFRFHKWIGYIYLTSGAVASAAAIGLNLSKVHSDVSIALATSTLAVVWLAVAAMAWRAIRNRRVDTHREWMIRSYVLTWTFVLCRMAQRPELMLVAEDAAADVIWITWVVPLFVCEFVLQWHRGNRAGNE